MKAKFDVGGEIKNLPVVFDRCVRVEFASSRSGSSPVLIIEHKQRYSRKNATIKDKNGKITKLPDIPLGSLSTRIDCKITDVPKSNNRNKTPGFTATIKIYNDDGSISSQLARRNQLMTDFLPKDKKQFTTQEKINAYKKYQQQKLWAIVKVGYWDESIKDANYTQVFAGIINSCFSYRRGVDTITELLCSDVYPEDLNTAGLLELAFDVGPNAVKTFSTEYATDTTVEDPYVSSTGTWEILALDVIRHYSIQKSGSKTFLQSSPAPTWVTEEDRESKKGWYQIVYDTEDVRQKAQSGPYKRIETFYSPKTDFDVLWANVLGVFPDYTVGFYIKDDPTANNWDGCRYYHIYKQQGRAISIPTSKRPKHVIYNYQNLISSPMLGTTSGLTVSMLLNPVIHAGEYLELALTDDARNVLGASVGMQGEQLGQFTSALQGDISQVVRQQSESHDGSVFNKPFLIYKVEHDFSTHTSNWKTTVTTVPSIATGGV